MAIMGDGEARTAISAFGTVGVALATVFDEAGGIDFAATAGLARHLVDQGCDMLVVSGTTGESPTTSDDEKDELLSCVLAAVGERARIIAGVGSNDTRHTIELAGRAKAVGAHGLLVVTPYYSKPSQAGVIAHAKTVAEATDLPIMLYDIPGRSGIPLTVDTLVELGTHPNILAVKDAKGDIASTMEVMGRSPLVYYSGEDALNWPLLAAGAIGVVSVVGHVATPQISRMVAAAHVGEMATARQLALELVPVVDTIMNHMPGVVAAKAALELQGLIENRATRLPVLPATEDQVEFLRTELLGSRILQ
jgi:4-hydroxy-tetrahydrodipicolinate synthase